MGTEQRLDAAFSQKQSFADISAICPHCGVYAGFVQVIESGFSGRFSGQPRVATNCVVHLARCRSCQGGVFGVGEKGQSIMLWPAQGWPDNSPSDLDEAFKADYAEARAVLPYSAKAASVLARRCLQSILLNKLNVKSSKLYHEIEEASKSDMLSMPTRQALHHVRKIGNIGAHAGQSTSIEGETDFALTLVEVTPSEAAYTLKVLEMLFNDLYVAPAQQAEMQAQLASK